MGMTCRPGWALALSMCLAPPVLAHAQADPAALRRVDVSVFAGATAVYTGLSRGRDAASVAGVDLNLPQAWRFRPSLEVRATTPIDRGTIDRQKDILGGLRVALALAHVHPYVDFLVGTGQIAFDGPYTTYAGSFLYAQPKSTVISPGAGVSFYLGAHFGVFADAQLARWSTPASLSGHLFSKPLTVGLSYRFALPHRRPGGP